MNRFYFFALQYFLFILVAALPTEMLYAQCSQSFPYSIDSAEGTLEVIAGNLDASDRIIPATTIPVTAIAGEFSSSPEGTTFEDLKNAAAFELKIDLPDKNGVTHPVTIFFFHTELNQYDIRAYVVASEVDGKDEGMAPRLLANHGNGSVRLTFSGDGTRNNLPAIGQPDLRLEIPWDQELAASTVQLLFAPFTQFSAPANILFTESDSCPADPQKVCAGQCGCGVSDIDSDNDAIVDCNDGCPDDSNKIEAGICGCGNSDSDSDGDQFADCIDPCPHDATKVSGGLCGCGVPEITSQINGVATCQAANEEAPLAAVLKRKRHQLTVRMEAYPDEVRYIVEFLHGRRKLRRTSVTAKVRLHLSSGRWRIHYRVLKAGISNRTVTPYSKTVAITIH